MGPKTPTRADRHDLILGAVEAHEKVDVRELAEMIGASEITIRRDLQELAAMGQVGRVHGAATRKAGRSTDRPFHVRAEQFVKAKAEIAAAAIELVSDGDALALDVGSTVGAVVPLLASRQRLTVVTANLRTAWQITAVEEDHSETRVVVAGGVVRPGELSMTGEGVREQLRRLRVDIALIGVAGIDATAGLTDFNLDDAEVKRVMVGAARRAIVLADHTKLGQERFAKVAGLDEVDLVITDGGADPGQLKKLRSAGVEVRVASRLSGHGRDGRDVPGDSTAGRT